MIKTLLVQYVEIPGFIFCRQCANTERKEEKAAFPYKSAFFSPEPVLWVCPLTVLIVIEAHKK